MKKTPVIAGIVVLVIVAAFAYSMSTKPEPESELRKQPSPSATTVQPAPVPNTTQPTDNQPQSRPGAYKNYSAASLAATPGTKIIFFHAPWCPQCRALEADIKAKTIPNNVTIFKVDYDSNQSLRQKYGVTIQTTLVKVDDDAKLVKKYVAYGSPTLAAVEANLLP